MKNKKSIIIAIVIIISIIILTFFGYICKKEKFYLEDNYYNYDMKKVSYRDINKLEKEKKSFVLFTYNPYCSLKIPCDKFFEEYAKNKNITILTIPFDKFKRTEYYKTVKYALSVIIINKGRIITYLDAEKDNDIKLYQDTNKFGNWIEKYIKLK